MISSGTKVGQTYDADSVAALLVTPDGMYVMQQRDDREDVDFPGFVGLFGGALEQGESAETALLRELEEELCFTPAQLAPFATLVFDERPSDGWFCRRRYFEVPIGPSEVGALDVREGRGMIVLEHAGIMRLPAVIPYDLCAILMHGRKERSVPR